MNFSCSFAVLPQPSFYRCLKVVVNDIPAHPTEKLESGFVPFQKCFFPLGRIGYHKRGTAESEPHAEQIDFGSLSGHHHGGGAPVYLDGFPRGEA